MMGVSLSSRSFLLRASLKGFLCLFPLLLLRSIITTETYLLFFPWYEVLYPQIELLILSMYAGQWSIQIVSSVILVELLDLVIESRNKWRLLLSVFCFSMLQTFTSNIVIAQETLPHLITLYGFSILIWISSHYALPHQMREQNVLSKSLERPEEGRINEIVGTTLTLTMVIPVGFLVSNLVTNGFVRVDFIILYIGLGCIIGIVTGLFMILLDITRHITRISRSSLRVTILLIISYLVLSQFQTWTLSFWLVFLFSISIMTFILRNRFHPTSDFVDQVQSKFEHHMEQLQTAEVFLIVLFRDFLGVLILWFVIILSTFLESVFTFFFVAFISPLSNSLIVALPTPTSSEVVHPNFLLIACTVFLLEVGLLISLWRKTGELELVIPRYRRFEPFIAILIALLVWLSFLPFISAYGLRSSIFSMLVLALSLVMIFRGMHLGEQSSHRKFVKWFSRTSSRIVGLLTLILVSSILLIPYYRHLWVAGLSYGAIILLSSTLVSALIVGASFYLTNGVIFSFQKYFINPQGPLLVVDITRDVIASIVVLFMVSSIVSISIEVLVPLTLVLVSVISLREHSPSDWNKLLYNGLKVCRGSHSSLRSIITLSKVLGVTGLLILSTWSTLVIYESASNPPSEVRVAVLDTGINSEDPQIATHLVASKSFVLTQYGYDKNDTSTSDHWIRGFHGTKVTKMVLEMFPRASIISAKVIGDGGASSEGISAAIHWAVEEEGADVINLSLGGPNLLEKDAAVEWAWNQGVVVVTSAGNGQNEVDWGATIQSPANSPYSIAVAALQSTHEVFNFSSWGPVKGAFIKPDVSALGNVFGSDYDRGTSFASPRVAGVAAALIDLCLERGLRWTPGLIKAAILKGATPLSYPEYVVGSGRVNLEASLNIILNALNIDGVPYVAYISPKRLPLDIEHVFTGTEYKFTVQVTCSIPTDFDITQTISSLQLVVNSSVAVNQTLLVPLTIMIPDSSTEMEASMSIRFAARGEVLDISCSINARPPAVRVAIDISHSISFRDSIFMIYLKLYEQLASLNIAVTEIRDAQDFRNFTDRGFDVLLIMNPWIDNSTLMPTESIVEIRTFYDNGGGVFFSPAQSGVYQNVTNVNRVLNWTGVSFLDNATRYYYDLNVSSQISDEDIEIDSLQSWILNVSSNGTVLLSTGSLVSGNALMVGVEGTRGRMIVAGTNSMFFDEELTGFTCLLVNWLAHQ